MQVKTKKSYNYAESGNECLAEAYRILYCYIRFMFNKYKLGNFNINVFQNCPHHVKYAYHLTGAISIARNASLNDENDIFYPSSQCKEIDILLKSFIFKIYKINLIYTKNFKQNKNNFYKPFKINFLKSLKNIIFDLRVFKNKNFKLSNNIKKPFDILLLTHPFIKSKNIDPYNYLTKKISSFSKKNKLISRNIIPSQIGLSIFDKLFGSFDTYLKLLSIFYEYKYISFANINFIISTYNRKKYKEKLKKFFLNKKIKFIIASYIDMKYEPIYYEAAQELGIRYYLYDFSVGYPLKNCKYIRYLPDVRKFADIVFFNSNFRMEQYIRAASYKNSNIKFLPHSCPQIEFSVFKRNKIILKKKELTIGVVDNMLFDDLIINYKDAYSLSEEVKRIDFKLGFILQSKRGELCEIFNKLNIKYLYRNPLKGDLSALRNSNIILSLGWQGAALKAAFLFNKPIIFYSKNVYPYKEHFFSFDRDKNNEINNLCRSLWFDQKTFADSISKLIEDKNFYKSINSNSLRLLELIGFVEGTVDEYFEKYLY